MPRNLVIGELEQFLLLVILQLQDSAHALRIRTYLKDCVGRPCSRGALYRTLDRLEGKGLVSWKLEAGSPRRGGHPRRLFQVTAEGILVLRHSRVALQHLWTGLEEVLG